MSVPVPDHAARQEIAEVLVRYATGIDRRSWDLLRSCFTVDCVADYGDIGVWNGADAVVSIMEEFHRECGHTMHRITNQAVWVEDDDVRARSYVDSLVMAADNLTGVRAVGFYEDVFVHGPSGWQISHRVFNPVLFEGIDLTTS